MSTTLIQPYNRHSTQARRKGAINVSTALARGGIATVYEMLGGVDAMYKWVKKNEDNEKVFYSQMLMKLIPAEMADSSRDIGNLTILVQRNPIENAPENRAIDVTPHVSAYKQSKGTD